MFADKAFREQLMQAADVPAIHTLFTAWQPAHAETQRRAAV